MVHLFIDLQYSLVKKKNIWSICRRHFTTHYHLIHLQDPQAMIKVVSCFNPEIPTATDFAFRFTVPILPQRHRKNWGARSSMVILPCESDACKNLRANLKFLWNQCKSSCSSGRLALIGPSFLSRLIRFSTSWWFQPIWNIWVKMGIFP